MRNEDCRPSYMRQTPSEDGSDLISRANAIDAICDEWCYVTYDNCPHWDDGFKCDGCDDVKRLESLPSADAVQGYAEWLEKIIVDAETLEWLCEDTPCKEWCDENCHYKSIQAECLRHLYEVSKEGDKDA